MANPLRCAIYTRKSTEDGLEQAFNSLDAQREACGAYILSQAGEGWSASPDPSRSPSSGPWPGSWPSSSTWLASPCPGASTAPRTKRRRSSVQIGAT